MPPALTYTHRDMEAEDGLIRERMGTARNGRGVREGNGAEVTKAASHLCKHGPFTTPVQSLLGNGPHTDDFSLFMERKLT